MEYFDDDQFSPNQAQTGLTSAIETLKDGDEPSPRHAAQAPPDDHWIVILTDPDGSDWSPWSVIAEHKKAAVARALADWFEWAHQDEDVGEDGDLDDPPEVIKVYRNSWIGRRY
jgi:hypothetical protein